MEFHNHAITAVIRRGALSCARHRKSSWKMIGLGKNVPTLTNDVFETTMPSDEPLQTGEVTANVIAVGECALVHIPSGKEAHILFDQSRSAYLVRYSCVSPMDEKIVRQAEVLGFGLNIEVRGRHRISVSKLAQYCSDPRDAAIRALKLIRMLPEVGETDWLWQTVYDYDQREFPAPDPPKNWPPESEIT